MICVKEGYGSCDWQFENVVVFIDCVLCVMVGQLDGVCVYLCVYVVWDNFEDDVVQFEEVGVECVEVSEFVMVCMVMDVVECFYGCNFCEIFVLILVSDEFVLVVECLCECWCKVFVCVFKVYGMFVFEDVCDCFVFFDEELVEVEIEVVVEEMSDEVIQEEILVFVVQFDDFFLFLYKVVEVVVDEGGVVWGILVCQMMQLM